jgi:hemolysin III
VASHDRHRSPPADIASAARHFAEEEIVPPLRGVLHAYALAFALAAAIVLVTLARSGEARIAAAIYGVGLCALFAASATYHRWWGDPRWKPLLRRLDHSVIFVFIAASYTPVAVLVLSSTLALVVLVSVWVGALAGVVLTVAWTDTPRWLLAACYLAVGWVAIIALPQLIDAVGVAPLVLFAAGGVLYSLGALAYATQRPDPWPRTFGFHEVFHTLVVAAAVLHYVAIVIVVRSPAAS